MQKIIKMKAIDFAPLRIQNSAKFRETISHFCRFNVTTSKQLNLTFKISLFAIVYCCYPKFINFDENFGIRNFNNFYATDQHFNTLPIFSNL